MEYLRKIFCNTINAASYLEYKYHRLKKKIDDNFIVLSLLFFILTFIIIAINSFNLIYNNNYPILKALNTFNLVSSLILSLLFASLLYYELYPELREVDIKSFYNNTEHEFRKLFSENSFYEVQKMLINANHVDKNGKWISEELKRDRDISVLIAILLNNGLLKPINLKTINIAAKSFFKKEFDYSRMTEVINDFKENTIKDNDMDTYQKLQFLDNIRI